MVYCHPGDGAPKCPFGAHKKSNAVVSSKNFVSPLDRGCERRFRFKSNGEMEASNGRDTAAQETIKTLCLNHDVVRLARESAILALPLSRRRKVSASEARKQAKLALERNGDGMFREFALAIHQVWARYAESRAAVEAALVKQAR